MSCFFVENRTDAELEQLFGAIRNSITTINLSYGISKFEAKKIANLAKILKVIPKGVTTLELYDNNLGTPTQTADELAQTLAFIPKTVKFLDLAANNLRYLEDGLATVLAAISNSVITLNLSGNQLGMMEDQVLINALGAIPKSVTTLNFYDKKFDAKPVAELIQILAAIPSHVKIEGHFGMFYDKTCECLNHLISTTKEIEAKEDPKKQLDLLKNVLRVIEPLYPDTSTVLALCDEVKTAILIMEGLSQVKAAEKLLNEGSSFSFLGSTSPLDTLLQTIDSVSKNISTVKSDSPLFAFAQETVLDLADKLYNQIPKNESPEDKAKRLELCMKILESDFIGKGNEKIIAQRDLLKTKIGSEQNITPILKK
jgi:hypothetical protein